MLMHSGLKSTASASIGLPHDGERAEFLTEDSVFIEFIKYLTKIDKDLFEPTLAREVDFNFTIRRVRELYRPIACVIWHRSENPTKYVGDRLGIKHAARCA